MTQVRSAMVNTNTLAALSEEFGMGDFLYLGRGIARGGGRTLRSLLANAFEAVLGAIFVDAGFDAAYHFYLDRFRALPEPVANENYKGRLQHAVQERFGLTPYYDGAGARGGRHREYTAVVYAGSEALGTGHGVSKQEAEQLAAKLALAQLEGQTAAKPRPRRPQPAAREEAVELAPAVPMAPPEAESKELAPAVPPGAESKELAPAVPVVPPPAEPLPIGSLAQAEAAAPKAAVTVRPPLEPIRQQWGLPEPVAPVALEPGPDAQSATEAAQPKPPRRPRPRRAKAEASPEA